MVSRTALTGTVRQSRLTTVECSVPQVSPSFRPARPKRSQAECLAVRARRPGVWNGPDTPAARQAGASAPGTAEPPRVNPALLNFHDKPVQRPGDDSL